MTTYAHAAIDDKDIADMQALRRLGLSLRQIGVFYSISAQSVMYYTRGHKQLDRPKSYWLAAAKFVEERERRLQQLLEDNACAEHVEHQ